MSLSEPARQRISDLVANHRVLLFMKGNRQFPQCGFSARVVRILDTLVPTYEAINVLADAELRDGVKEFSSWPTLPQLYVNGQFVGGCDIVSELHRSGRLRELLEAEAATDGAPASGEGHADNPHQPARVRPLRPAELKRLLDSRVPLQLIDVRTDEERAIASLPGSLAVADDDARKDLDRDLPVVLYCHHGIRSRAAAERLARDGFRSVYNLEGGIEAWALEVDPSVARY